MRLVDVYDIRRQFNAFGYADLVRSGRIRAKVEANRRVPAEQCRLYGLQVGTRSQLLAYYDAGVIVARVHQFLQPDGTIGASGKPDPYELIVDDELWVIK